MKFSYLALVCFLVFSSNKIYSQDAIAGKLDIHAGWGFIFQETKFALENGATINVEPKFWWKESTICIGAKIGANFLNSPGSNFKSAPISTLMIMGEKYKGSGPFYYFVGGAAGLFYGGQIKKVNGIPTDFKAGKQLGIVPRIGVQYGPWRLVGEANMRGKAYPRVLGIMLGYQMGYTVEKN